MGSRNRFIGNTLFDFVIKRGVNEFLYNKMVLFVGFFWFLISTFVLCLFRFITRFLFRFRVYDDSGKANSQAIFPKEDNPIVLPEPEVIEFEDSEYDGFGDKETPKFGFKFQFQTYDDKRKSTEESPVAVSPDEASGASTSKYHQFIPSKDFRCFIEEPEVMNFTIKELYINSNEDSSKEILHEGFLSKKNILQHSLGKETIHEDVIGESYVAEDLGKQESLVFGEFLESEKGQSDDFEKNSSDKEDLGKQESLVFGEFLECEKDQSDEFEKNSSDKEDFSDEIQLLSDKDFLGFDSDLESECFGGKFSGMNNIMDSSSDAFLSDEEVDEKETGSEEDVQSSEEIHLEKSGIQVEKEVEVSELIEKIESVEGFEEPSTVDQEDDVSDQMPIENLLARFEEEIDLVNDCENSESYIVYNPSDLETKANLARELDKASRVDHEDDISDQMPIENLLARFEEEIDLMNVNENSGNFTFPEPSNLEAEAHFEKEYNKIKAECDREDSGGENAEQKNGSEKPEASNSQDTSYSEEEEEEEDNDLEILWEHQHLIEQLKMELKKVKATGLPTILEESESPRLSEDLKPWKIDEKFLHEDRMSELHKFYRSYRERMRKFDILNYQKMYAIGFLQLKDPLQSISTKKSSTPTLTSVLSQSFRLPKRRKPEEDSTVKFVKELQSDLEVVYVGHLCLSWEFLHWEYGKTRELLESDPYETRQYNEVAGEFQQFQVLMQRFLENEPFQGPRVQNYIKNRCILRNLLQVPVIKEDSKDKEGRIRRKDGITCSMLLEIIEESIRIYWDFVRADKDEANVVLKGLLRPQIELQDPADAGLLVDVQTDLQKKEKKLKDILRSGNCIVRRFQKQHEEERPDQLLFFSHIDLKLVARVLKMSRITTEQLGWCHKKLKKINFVHRKLQVEPSFLLFPC